MGKPLLYGETDVRPQAEKSSANPSSVWVKADPSVADPAPGSYGWIAVLSHGYFGISITNADLDRLGVTSFEKKESVRIK